MVARPAVGRDKRYQANFRLCPARNFLRSETEFVFGQLPMRAKSIEIRSTPLTAIRFEKSHGKKHAEGRMSVGSPYLRVAALPAHWKHSGA